jgi:hypothetical protein
VKAAALMLTLGGRFSLTGQLQPATLRRFPAAATSLLRPEIQAPFIQNKKKSKCLFKPYHANCTYLPPRIAAFSTCFGAEAPRCPSEVSTLEIRRAERTQRKKQKGKGDGKFQRPARDIPLSPSAAGSDDKLEQ